VVTGQRVVEVWMMTVVMSTETGVDVTPSAEEIVAGVVSAEVDSAGEVSTGEVVTPSAEEVVPGAIPVAVTGQIVVETGTITVVRTVEWAGQFVTVSAQLMMVETRVSKIVEVVSVGGVVTAGVVSVGEVPAEVVSLPVGKGGVEVGRMETPAVEVEAGGVDSVPSLVAEEDGVVTASEEAGVVAGMLVVGLLVGGTVLEAELQSNPTLWKPMLQLSFPPPDPLGRITETFFAPPHCVFLTVVPLFLQDDFCLQVDPSGMS
jgi:hypothetical protein